jgi:hypothetical protein
VSSLEVTATAGNTGPVIVLAGEADYAGIAELNMALEGVSSASGMGPG